MHPCVHRDTVYNSQDMETTYVSINRWMAKEAVVYLYSGIWLSHKKNEIISFAATRMDLEIIIQSEVSQSEEEKYHILFKCGI